MVRPVKPATSPRIRRSTSIAYHTNLGPWDQVFNPRGSRRDWPKEHVDLFGFLLALFSGPSFSTLAFSSTACPFPSAWECGSRKNNQKLRVPTRLRHFPKIKLVMQTTGTWPLYLLDLPLIPADQFFRGQKSKQLITLIGCAIVSSTHSKTVLSVIGKTKPTKPKQVKRSQTFGYTSVFLSGIAGASSTWRGHLSASATGSEEMDDYDVFTKTCMKLGPRYLPRRTKNTEQARRPANHAKLATSVDFKGTPFVDAKMVQKQQF